MLDGKFDGTYLEIGSGDPVICNNTILLESHFGWKGISIEIDVALARLFADNRSNVIVNEDATVTSYESLFVDTKIGPIFDYLQIDCEPPAVSLQVLKKIPFDECKFAVITFEHDYYRCESTREESREILSSFGYELIVNDIGITKEYSYEDWWVHPDLVSRDIINKMKCVDNNIKKADEYMLGDKNGVQIQGREENK
jgi:hypothetical protein